MSVHLQKAAIKHNPYIFWVFPVIRAGGRSQGRCGPLCFPWCCPEELCRRLPAIPKLWVVRRSTLIPGPVSSVVGGGGVKQCSKGGLYITHSHRQSQQWHCVPGFGPSIPKQLKDGHLFRGEVSLQKFNSIFGKVRRDDWTCQFRTSTALQHL